MAYSPSLTADQIQRMHATLLQCNFSRTQTAKALGIPRSTLCSQLRVHPYFEDQKPSSVDFPKTEMPPEAPKLPAEPAKIRVVLMTAAQDETGLHEAGFKNLEAYAAYRGGEIMIGGFTYQKGLFEDHRVKTGAFAQKVIPLLQPDIVELAPRLVWFGKANILPTAADPLSGWETNTRDKWAVFPHAKIALKCVPVMPGRPGKQIMTTGVITRANYVQRNAGQKAEFHHTPGATIAEIAPDGRFWLRQLTMNKDGSFQDLDVIVRDGGILTGQRVESITWGDVHLEELDLDVAQSLWGYPSLDRSSMLDDLKPVTQFFHDSFSFKARSHHTIKDPHERALRVIEQEDSVADMLGRTAQFLHVTSRDFCRSIHVASNHNVHIDRWLKNPDGHADVKNARIWHQLNLAWFEAIEAGEGKEFQAHVAGLKLFNELPNVSFLAEGASYLICQDTAPIECGLHGHVGPRGAKGSPTGLAKIVERVNCAHTHEPQIRDGAYYAGTSSKLNLAYATKGPTTWHHAEVVTYASGKRTIVTLCEGKYRA